MTPIRTLLLAALLSGVSGLTFAHTEKSSAVKAESADREQSEWGRPGDGRRLTRTISVQMLDSMRFVPDRVVVKQGETVKFVVRNDGKAAHEMVIGSRKAIDEHAALMVKYPGMEHDDPDSVRVAPGEVGNIVWDFNRAGEFHFACLIPGHFQAGMAGKIGVIAAQGK